MYLNGVANHYYVISFCSAWNMMNRQSVVLIFHNSRCGGEPNEDVLGNYAMKTFFIMPFTPCHWRGSGDEVEEKEAEYWVTGANIWQRYVTINRTIKLCYSMFCRILIHVTTTMVPLKSSLSVLRLFRRMKTITEFIFSLIRGPKGIHSLNVQFLTMNVNTAAFSQIELRNCKVLPWRLRETHVNLSNFTKDWSVGSEGRMEECPACVQYQQRSTNHV